MIDRKGCAYLIDFGASKQLSADESATLSTSTGMSYTAGYAPSEQIEQNYERMGAWTDYYALGATLYRLLTLQQPPSPSEISEDLDDAFHFPASVSSQSRQLIRWMMTPNRKKRPQSVDEIQRFLSENNSTKDIGTKPGFKDSKDETTILQIGMASSGSESSREETSFERVSPQNLASQSQAKSQSIEKAEDKGNKTLKDTWKKKWSIVGISAALLVGLIWLLAGLGVFDGAESSSSGQDNTSLFSTSSEIIDKLVNNMVYVEGGTFTMGATPEQGSDADSDEELAHEVTLSSFSIGKYEVTQEEWEAVMGGNPSEFKGKKLPVESVSWDDCQDFIKKLNQLTGKKFRLPTEAEWEYAARGGSKSLGYKYSGGKDIGAVAWYYDNSGNKTHEVGLKQPNELGLYDMSGNIWEWCSDWYGDYLNTSQTNPTGPTSGSYRVCRGGSWDDNAWNCRVSIRYNDSPDYHIIYLGLRLAL